MNISGRIIQHFVDEEGKINHFYLDTKGIVTIGIGCVVTLQQALTFPFLNKETLLNATTAEIKKDYDLVNGQEKGKPASFYATGQVCYLPENVIQEIFTFRLQHFAQGLKVVFADFDSYSESLKLVLLDMAYNLGIAGLSFKFPKFCIAVKEGNSEAAATESIRVGIGQIRNEWTFRTLSEPETWYKA